MSRREQIIEALEVQKRLTDLLVELDLASGPYKARRETLGFWRHSLTSELQVLEAKLKWRDGMASFPVL